MPCKLTLVASQNAFLHNAASPMIQRANNRLAVCVVMQLHVCNTQVTYDSMLGHHNLSALQHCWWKQTKDCLTVYEQTAYSTKEGKRQDKTRLDKDKDKTKDILMKHLICQALPLFFEGSNRFCPAGRGDQRSVSCLGGH